MGTKTIEIEMFYSYKATIKRKFPLERVLA